MLQIGDEALLQHIFLHYFFGFDLFKQFSVVTSHEVVDASQQVVERATASW